MSHAAVRTLGAFAVFFIMSGVQAGVPSVLIDASALFSTSALSTIERTSGELAFSIPFEPISDRWVYVGPRFSIGGAWSGRARLMGTVGGEVIVWWLNAIGTSLLISYTTAPSWRWEPSFAIRLHRIGEESAFALKVGVLRDTSLGWAVASGITLQLGGVSQ